MMTESTASIGGYMALGYRRVAGVQLYINHLKPARLGDRIKAKANPIRYLDPDAYLDKVCVPPLPPPPAACPRVTP